MQKLGQQKLHVHLMGVLENLIVPGGTASLQHGTGQALWPESCFQKLFNTVPFRLQHLRHKSGMPIFRQKPEFRPCKYIFRQF